MLSSSISYGGVLPQKLKPVKHTLPTLPSREICDFRREAQFSAAECEKPLLYRANVYVIEHGSPPESEKARTAQSCLFCSSAEATCLDGGRAAPNSRHYGQSSVRLQIGRASR